MDNKYETLVHILDKIIADRPENRYNKIYCTDNKDALQKSRSRAYIHLFLMAQYGMLDFENRESFITDGSFDGGVDAYYIDKQNKTINIIQSKFRNNKDNFESKPIEPDELLSMDIRRITSGETHDEAGNEYNGKIKGFQRELDNIRNIGKYEYKVVILANVKQNKFKLDRLTGGFESTVFNFEETYNKLVFPVISGNYFNQEELEVNINLKNSQHPRIQYTASLGEQNANITVLFAPTSEIAKILYKYKNSILRFNPRSYLDLRKNSVNSDILDTLINTQDNQFALFNNGITIVCGDCRFTELTGTKNKASLSLHSPQIINGGQTAYTLSNILEQNINSKERLDEIFDGKEVLVKIISFVNSVEDEEEDDDSYEFTGFSEQNLKIIEKVSEATNRQNPIDDADRKANQQNQIDFQKFAYENYGFYYERKRGEFGDGITQKYISRNYLIKRDDLIRCCLAKDGKPGDARSASKKHLFSSSVIDKYMSSRNQFDSFVVAYKVFLQLKDIEKEMRSKTNKYAEDKYGSALRYGKFAVVAAVFSLDHKVNVENVGLVLSSVLKRWKSFETNVLQNPKNESFFSKDKNMLNYYKSQAVDTQVIEFFSTRDA